MLWMNNISPDNLRFDSFSRVFEAMPCHAPQAGSVTKRATDLGAAEHDTGITEAE
jgi:hypothetical protein